MGAADCGAVFACVGRQKTNPRSNMTDFLMLAKLVHRRALS